MISKVTWASASLMLVLAMTSEPQERHASPLPIWIGERSADNGNQRVFLTPDEHTVVVLAPADPATGLQGPKKIVRVPLMNDLQPSIFVSVSEAEGKYTFRYIVGNGRAAKDAIGDWSLVIPESDLALEVTRPTAADGKFVWTGAAIFAVIAKQAAFPAAPIGRYFLWFHQEENLALRRNPTKCHFIGLFVTPGFGEDGGTTPHNRLIANVHGVREWFLGVRRKSRNGG